MSKELLGKRNLYSLSSFSREFSVHGRHISMILKQEGGIAGSGGKKEVRRRRRKRKESSRLARPVLMIMQNLNVIFIHDLTVFVFSLPSHSGRKQYL